MYLKKLQVRYVRAIESADLQFSPSINVITGVNGSGKTSLLEAIFLLGVGRSFRSNQIKSVINNDSDELSVFAQLSNFPNDSSNPTDHESNGKDIVYQHNQGILRDRLGNFKIRINGEDQSKLSQLARFLPVLVITPDSYKLLTAGPVVRRQFLDLSVFHVEHQFSKVWQRYNRVLKQRNAQLKKAKLYSELSIWDKEFAELTEAIHQIRKVEFLSLKTHLEAIQSIFLPQYRVQYTYQAGWDSESNTRFLEQLEKGFDLDRRYGFSNLGAHKSDIKITIDNTPVQDVLSRGEQKMLVTAMHLAQARRLSIDLNKDCLLLIDDLPSELDKQKQALLVEQLLGLSTNRVQIFISSIKMHNIEDSHDDSTNIMTTQQSAAFLGLNKEKIKLFHVEHGKVTELQ